eukprot:Phypoly_transcript_09818.p1 GENE.Phypoly_transcript_09818~~Phypoly_transcript_09818.p1  ORF type:complete len:410 (+),score=50.01 Phypoly_transcript_09818:121-1230(+)
MGSSWWPSTWRWVPTSPKHLEESENTMLSAVRTPFERMMVRLRDGNQINTIKSGSGPPLVLVHGFGAGIGFWCGNIDALSRRYTVYALDMPGFGRSSRPKITFKNPEQAEDYFTDSLEDWAQTVGLKKFVLLGHSFGGYISALYALKHHEKVAHLVLADPWGVPSLAKDLEPRQLTMRQKLIVSLVSMSSPLLLMRAAGPYGPSLVAKTRPDLPAKFGHLHNSPEVVVNYVYHINAQSPPTGEQGFSILTESLGWAKNPLINRLTALPASVPATFIYGKHTWMDKEAGAALSQSMAGPTTLLEVSNSGHHLYIDNAPDFNAAVLDVTRRLSPEFIKEHAHTHEQHPSHLHHHHTRLEEGGGVTEKVLTE